MNWTSKMEVHVGDKFKLENFRLTAIILRTKYTDFTMVDTVALRFPITTFYDWRTTDLQLHEPAIKERYANSSGNITISRIVYYTCMLSLYIISLTVAYR